MKKELRFLLAIYVAIFCLVGFNVGYACCMPCNTPIAQATFNPSVDVLALPLGNAPEGEKLGDISIREDDCDIEKITEIGSITVFVDDDIFEKYSQRGQMRGQKKTYGGRYTFNSEGGWFESPQLRVEARPLGSDLPLYANGYLVKGYTKYIGIDDSTLWSDDLSNKNKLIYTIRVIGGYKLDLECDEYISENEKSNGAMYVVDIEKTDYDKGIARTNKYRIYQYCGETNVDGSKVWYYEWDGTKTAICEKKLSQISVKNNSAQDVNFDIVTRTLIKGNNYRKWDIIRYKLFDNVGSNKSYNNGKNKKFELNLDSYKCVDIKTHDVFGKILDNGQLVKKSEESLEMNLAQGLDERGSALTLRYKKNRDGSLEIYERDSQDSSKINKIYRLRDSSVIKEEKASFTLDDLADLAVEVEENIYDNITGEMSAQSKKYGILKKKTDLKGKSGRGITSKNYELSEAKELSRREIHISKNNKAGGSTRKVSKNIDSSGNAPIVVIESAEATNSNGSSLISSVNSGQSIITSESYTYAYLNHNNFVLASRNYFDPDYANPPILTSNNENPNYVYLKISGGENWDDIAEIVLPWGQTIGVEGIELLNNISTLECIVLGTEGIDMTDNTGKVIYRCKYIFVDGSFQLMEWEYYSYTHPSLGGQLAGTYKSNGLYSKAKYDSDWLMGIISATIDYGFLGEVTQTYIVSGLGKRYFYEGSATEYGTIYSTGKWERAGNDWDVGCGCDGYGSSEGNGPRKYTYYSFPYAGGLSGSPITKPPFENEGSTITHGEYIVVQNIDPTTSNNFWPETRWEKSIDIYGVTKEKINKIGFYDGKNQVIEVRPGFSYSNPYSTTIRDGYYYEASGNGVYYSKGYRDNSFEKKELGYADSGRVYSVKYNESYQKLYESTPDSYVTYSYDSEGGLSDVYKYDARYPEKASKYSLIKYVMDAEHNVISQSGALYSTGADSQSGSLSSAGVDSQSNNIYSDDDEVIDSYNAPVYNISYEMNDSALWKVLSAPTPEPLSGESNSNAGVRKIKLTGYGVPVFNDYHVFYEEINTFNGIETTISEQLNKSLKMRQVIESKKNLETSEVIRNVTTYVSGKEVNFISKRILSDLSETFISGYTIEYNNLGDISAVYYGPSKTNYYYVDNFEYYPKTAAINVFIPGTTLVVGGQVVVINEDTNPIYGKGRLKAVIRSGRYSSVKKGVKYDYIPNNQKNAGMLASETYLIDFENYTGKTVNYTYDDKGSLINSQGFDVAPVSFEYNEFGDTVKMQLASSETHWEYDDQTGKLLSKTDGVGNSRSWTLKDESASYATFTDERGIVTTQTSLPGNKTQVIKDGYSTTVYEKDINDNYLNVSVDKVGAGVSLWAYTYDYSSASNMPTEETYPDSYKLTREFDKFGNVSKVKVLNQLGESIYEVDYTYSMDGSMANLVAEGKQISYQYQNGYKTEMLCLLDNNSNLEIEFGYDGLSRLVSMGSDSTRKVVYSTDSLDKIRSTTYYEIGSLQYKWDYAYSWDSPQSTSTGLVGAYKSYPPEYPTSWNVTHTNEDGQNTSLSYGFHKFASIGGNIVSVVADNQNVASLQFTSDNANRLTSLNYSVGHGGLPIHGWAADNASLKAFIDGIELDSSQLITRANRGGKEFMFAVKPAQVPLYAKLKVEATLAEGGVDGADAKSLRLGSKYIAPCAESITSDAAGNIIGDARWAYTWDEENRIVKIETAPSAQAAGIPWQRFEYEYDWNGLKVRSKEYSLGEDNEAVLIKESRHIYDNYNQIMEITKYFDGVTPEAVKKFYYGADLLGSLYATGGTGGLVMTSFDGVKAYVLSDIRGSVDSLYAASDGALLGHYEYDAWGDITDIVQNEGFDNAPLNTYIIDNPLRYSGRYHEVAPNLYYYAFRHYSPVLKRWLSRDPIEEEGGLNLYGFLNNDPINYFDSLGLEKCIDGKRECVIDLYIAHGSDQKNLEKLDYKPFRRAKSDQEGKIKGTYAQGFITCHPQHVNGKFAGIPGNEVFAYGDNSTRSNLAGLISIDVRVIERMLAYISGDKSFGDMYDEEIERATKHGNEMCASHCCINITIRTTVIPLSQFRNPEYKDGAEKALIDRYKDGTNIVKKRTCTSETWENKQN